MSFLQKKQILLSVDHEIKEVKIPQWGGSIGVKTFNAETRARLLNSTKQGDEMPVDWMERIIISSACDADGNLLFDEKDLPALAKKNATVLEKIFLAAIELNGLTENAVEKTKGE